VVFNLGGGFVRASVERWQTSHLAQHVENVPVLKLPRSKTALIVSMKLVAFLYM